MKRRPGVRSRLRRRRRRDRPRPRLPAGPPERRRRCCCRSSCARSPCSRRRLDGEHRRERAVRRRRGRRRHGRRPRAGPSRGVEVVDTRSRSTPTRSTQLGWDIGGSGLPHRAVAERGRRRRGAPRRRRRRPARGARADDRRRRRLGRAPGRPEGCSSPRRGRSGFPTGRSTRAGRRSRGSGTSRRRRCCTCSPTSSTRAVSCRDPRPAVRARARASAPSSCCCAGPTSRSEATPDVPRVTWYTVLVLAVGVERLAELVVSQRHATWAFAHGGVESGAALPADGGPAHRAAGRVPRRGAGGRPAVPARGSAGRCSRSSWRRRRCAGGASRRSATCWNTRVIVVPGVALVHRGPYRWLRHPNYVAVVVEGVALPLVHTAWVTALGLHRAQRDPAARASASRPRSARCAPVAPARHERETRCRPSTRRRRAARSGSPWRSRRAWRGCASSSSSRARRPIDKACGEGLMPGAVAALARLGVHPAGHVLDRDPVPRAATAPPTTCSRTPPGSASGAPPCTSRSRAAPTELGVEVRARQGRHRRAGRASR